MMPQNYVLKQAVFGKIFWLRLIYFSKVKAQYFVICIFGSVFFTEHSQVLAEYLIKHVQSRNPALTQYLRWSGPEIPRKSYEMKDFPDYINLLFIAVEDFLCFK